jgi:hypothetical protein
MIIPSTSKTLDCKNIVHQYNPFTTNFNRHDRMLMVGGREGLVMKKIRTNGTNEKPYFSFIRVISYILLRESRSTVSLHTSHNSDKF